MRAYSYILSLLLVVSLAIPFASEAKKAADTDVVNKLLYMYNFYYLPFSVEFKQGRTLNDVLPYLADGEGSERLITAPELQKLDSEWQVLKEPWRKKSLLLTTPVLKNQSVRISPHIASHRISVSRGILDGLSVPQRIQFGEAIRTKSPMEQASIRQLTFLRTLLGPQDEGRVNLFLVSASWCDSCREYRVLFESYVKAFGFPELNLHSVVIEDEKEQIFEKPLLGELFPNPKKYSHDSIPRFLLLESGAEGNYVLEEGEALREVYLRFFKAKRGYLDSKSTLFKKPASIRSLSTDGK